MSDRIPSAAGGKRPAPAHRSRLLPPGRAVLGALAASALALAVAAPLAAPSAAAAPAGKAARGLGAQRPIGPDPAVDLLAHGNLTMASNSVLTCDDSDGSVCNDTEGTNNNRTKYVKTDPDAPGDNASSAQLVIPAGSQVRSARLYWQFNPTNTSNAGGTSGDINAGDKVSWKVPGSSSYEQLTADTYDWFDQQVGGTPPEPLLAGAGVKDVTAQVKAAGPGNYTVAGIQACAGRSSAQNFGGNNVGCWGGWSLVVAYENQAEPLRYLQVWDGFQLLRSPDNLATLTLSGIHTPATAPPATMGVTVGDGDVPIAGDQLLVGSSVDDLTVLPMPGPAGTATDNAFTSRIDHVAANGTGSNLTTRTPAPVNNYGYDARTIDVTGRIPAGSTQAVLRINGAGDALHPQAVWLAVDALEPDLQITKANQPAGSTTNNPPGNVDPGAEITYTFTVANRHKDGTAADLDTATGVTLTDALPAGTGYVDGSGPGCTAAGRNVTCAVGDLRPGAETTVSFRARVDAGLAPGTKLDNTASLAYRGAQTGRDQQRTSNTVRNTVSEHTGYRIAKTADKAQALPGDTVKYQVDITNTGNAPLTGLTVTDDLSAVLDDADYNGDAAATAGKASYAQPVLSWTGDLPVGAGARLTYTVKVKDPAAGDHTLRNTVVADRPGGNCPAGSTAGECTATVTVTTFSPTPTASPTATATASPTTEPTGSPTTDATGSPTASPSAPSTGTGTDSPRPQPTTTPDRPGGSLAQTGSQVALIGGIGAAVVLAGAAFVLASRRRRHRH
ncbi:LPXTG cell wall anchor domain-containing protein [Kitasatospora sp. NPDC059463]|uniref:DUF7927 domain-containing protein n=1 Tax=unclassified Kitasatospora TaxID=2633591 RepID=UPI003690C96E